MANFCNVTFRKLLSPNQPVHIWKMARCYCNKKDVYEVIMVRHGQSEWNDKNLFTGWFDAQLTELGTKEATSAGVSLKKGNYKFDIAFCSVLTRAKETLRLILEQIGQTNLKVINSWRLNERHYGTLTGLNKKETAEKYGEEQVKKWRRSYDIPPPAMEPGHAYYDKIVKDARYANDPPLSQFPMGESLKMTLERTLPFWDGSIVPEIKSGKKVIVAAHGNSLRGIVKKLDNMNEEQIMGCNLPTGIPFMYVLDKDMKPVPGGSMKFLGDPETVKKAMETVANQAKVK